MSPVSPELSLWVFLEPSKGMPTTGQLRKEHAFLENADNVRTHTHTHTSRDGSSTQCVLCNNQQQYSRNEKVVAIVTEIL